MAYKKEFRFFTIADVEQEQEYLRWQHYKGWRFTGVTGIGTYHFESCEPEDVVYQLDYSPNRKANFTEYVQMYRDCGWEYLQDFVGFSYFRKPVSQMDSPEEIFCDDDSRREMIVALLKRRLPALAIGLLIPLFWFVFGLLLPQLVMGYSSVLTSAAVAMMIILLPFWAFLIVIFGRLWKYWRSLNDRWE